jgi:hypothetical protein
MGEVARSSRGHILGRPGWRADTSPYGRQDISRPVEVRSVNEPELLPIVSGLFVGCVLGLVRPGLRVPVGVGLAIVFGLLATVASGEFLESWAFLLIDIPLVAIAAVIGFAATYYLRRRTRQAI